MLESTREVITAQRDSLGLGLYAAERQRARSVAKSAGAGKYAEDAFILSPAGECAGNTVHGGSVRSRAGWGGFSRTFITFIHCSCRMKLEPQHMHLSLSEGMRDSVN